MKLSGKKDMLIIGAALAVCLVAALIFVGPSGSMVRVYVGEELNKTRILGKAIAFQSSVR